MDLHNTIFISDLDGTLLTTDKKINQANIDAIVEYQHSGGKFTIATGRSHHMIKSFLGAVHYDLPMIVCNGAMIYEPYKSEVLWAEYLPSVVSDIVKDIHFTFKSVATDIYTVDSQHYLRMNDTEKWHQNLLKLDFEYIDCLDNFNKPIVKLLFADTPEVIDELCEYVKKFSGVSFVRSLDKLLEILPNGISKSSAVKKLQEITCTSDHSVFTAGDYDNDIEMLKASDISFCPSNSEESVKSVADVTLCATNDDGMMKEALSYLVNK